MRAEEVAIIDTNENKNLSPDILMHEEVDIFDKDENQFSNNYTVYSYF